MPVRAVAFDLDDTLYPELTYVRSGFAAAARLVSDVSGADPGVILAAFLKELAEHGRGYVFDAVLERLRIKGVSVAALVAGYRTHVPTIELPTETADVLCQLRRMRLGLYVVTDGDPHVQRAKVMGLGLRAFVNGVFYTWDEGAAAGKPSPRGFDRLVTQTGLPRGDLVYVADNPAKDFIAARRAGVQSVRLLTGPHSLQPPPSRDHWPDWEVLRLHDVVELVGRPTPGTA